MLLFVFRFVFCVVLVCLLYVLIECILIINDTSFVDCQSMSYVLCEMIENNFIFCVYLIVILSILVCNTMHTFVLAVLDQGLIVVWWFVIVFFFKLSIHSHWCLARCHVCVWTYVLYKFKKKNKKTLFCEDQYFLSSRIFRTKKPEVLCQKFV